VVQRSAAQIGAVCHIRIGIQSTVKDPAYLKTRIEAFLSNFRETIVSMSEEEFRTNIQSIITKKEEKPHTMRKLAAKFWDRITNHHADFDRDLKEIQHLKTGISKEELLQFYDDFLLYTTAGGNLSVQVFGKSHPLPTADLPQVDENFKSKPKIVKITDFVAFKHKMFTFPVRGDA